MALRSKTITLPVSKEEIEIFAPTVRAMKMAESDGGKDIAKNARLVAICTNKTNEEIDLLDYADFEAIAQVVGDFLGHKEQ